jgi:hypothetical protein
MANEITSVPKLIKGYESATSRLAKYKEQAAEVARRGTMGMAGLGGAALIGVVKAYDYQKLPGTEIDTGLIMGGAAILAGVIGAGNSYSDVLVGGGIGLAAPDLSRMVETAVREQRAKQ